MITQDQIVNRLAQAQTVHLHICPVCGNDRWEYFGGRFHYDLRFEYWICTTCSLVGQSPRIADEAVSDFYEHYYRRLYQGPQPPLEEGFLFQQRRGRNLLQILRDTDRLACFSHILDMGCAHGGLLSVAREEFQSEHVVGVELDKIATEWSEKTGVRVFPTLDAVRQADLKDFDIITMAHVLEHLTDIEGTLRQLRALLKDDGYLCIEVPHTCEGACFQLAHPWGFNESSLSRLLAKVELRLVKAVTHGYPRVPHRDKTYLVMIAQNSLKPTNLHYASTPGQERMRRYTTMRNVTRRAYRIVLVKNTIKQLLGRRKGLMAHSYLPSKLRR